MVEFEYDKHEIWEPFFSHWMREIASPEAIRAASCPQEYISDARDILLDAIGKDELAGFLAEKLASHSVRVFHGTRVSGRVLNAIEREGLKPLNLSSRKATLVDELQSHPDWLNQAHRLDRILHKYGPGWERAGAGKREDGGVHVCLSRAGLLYGANHYLTHGAEVDSHIMNELFPGGSGLAILRQKRTPKLVSFTLSFADAERAASPYGIPQETLPFVAGKFFSAWAFRLSKPEWRPADSRDAIALRVQGAVSAKRLMIEAVDDAEL